MFFSLIMSNILHWIMGLTVKDSIRCPRTNAMIPFEVHSQIMLRVVIEVKIMGGGGGGLVIQHL